MIESTCSVSDCGRASVRRGWCDPHYRRWRSHGDPTLGGLIRLRSTSGAICSVDGCERGRSDSDLCSKHHQRIQRTGTTDPAPRLGACRVEGCSRREVKFSELCRMHARRMTTSGTVDAPLAKTIPECLIGGCSRQARGGWGWCPMHYGRYRVTGDPLKTKRDHLICEESVTGERVCVRCKERKTLELFKLNGRSLNGRLRVCDACASEISSERYRSEMLKDPTGIPRRGRAAYLKRKYGITQDQYDEMNTAQAGLCATCQIGGVALFIDHDHDSGVVRSLLCNDCNLALGHVNDSTIVLQNLITYIEAHRVRKAS